MAEGHLSQQDNQETIDWLQAVYLVATLGPSNIQNAQWARVWECNRWMPFNWANTSEYDLNPSGFTGALYMYGPYLVPNAPSGSDASVNTRISGTLTVYLQFRGQR